LAALLSSLGRARTEVGFDAERYRLVESNLLEADTIFESAGARFSDAGLPYMQRLVLPYEAWDEAAPSADCAAKLVEWKAKLEAAHRSTSRNDGS
jgi:hypothetical protein